MSFLVETIREEFEYSLGQLKRITSHGPSLGRFVEVLLLNLLKKYMPASLDFTSGFIRGVSVDAQTTTQIDIIAYDRLAFPILFDIGEFKVVPARSVKGIIEVKSTLTMQKLLEFLDSSTYPSFKEVPLTSKMYLLSVSSRITAKKAFGATQKFYDQKPHIRKFISSIYCLDWSEMIVFNDYWKEKEITVRYGRIGVDRELSLSPFLGILLNNLYGEDALDSIANNLGPSLFKSYEEASFKLSYT